MILGVLAAPGRSLGPIHSEVYWSGFCTAVFVYCPSTKELFLRKVSTTKNVESQTTRHLSLFFLSPTSYESYYLTSSYQRTFWCQVTAFQVSLDRKIIFRGFFVCNSLAFPLKLPNQNS